VYTRIGYQFGTESGTKKYDKYGNVLEGEESRNLGGSLIGMLALEGGVP
jgi:hypothetical protein